MSKYRLLSLLLAVLLLAGCTGPSGQEQAPSSVPETTQAAPETTEATIPTELTPQGVNLLSNRKFDSSPSAAVLDQRTVAFLTTEYLPDRQIAVSHLMVLDLYTDTVVAEATVDRALSFPVQSHLPGFLPVFDQTGQLCTLLDRNLETISTFSCPERGGVFAPDQNSYYYISAQRICRMDISTGEWSYLDTELELPVESITDYDMEENLLLLQVHTQYYLTDLCVGGVDLDTGELLLLTDEAVNCSFASDGILLEQWELVTHSNLIRTRWDSSDAQKLTQILPRSDAESSFLVPFSDYHATLCYDARNAYNLSSFLLYRFDGTYSGCELYDLTDGMEPDRILSLPDGNLLAVDHNRRRTRLALICPELLTFTPVSDPESVALPLLDESIRETYQEQSVYVEVPRELDQVRSTADALEEKYDITILMSNQCDSIISQAGLPIQPTSQAQLANEAALLENALTELDAALSLYPQHFFSQFRNSAGERGILVILAENISWGPEDQNVDILGVTYDMGDWYPISVDITTHGLTATYCHEIWHAMENKILDINPSLLSDVRWGELNPEGFSYKGVVEGYYNHPEHTYLEGLCGSGSYFVDTYAKTLPQEDRARLMEYVMTADQTAKYMMEAPVLYQKMQIMINAVRGVFDTTGWENVLWERFHS